MNLQVWVKSLQIVRFARNDKLGRNMESHNDTMESI